MKNIWKICFLSALLGSNAYADDQAGDFDYYVLALSWTPGFCEIEGDGKDSPLCLETVRKGFSFHGLWPQYVDGWPQYCHTTQRDPSHQETKKQADLFGASGYAWYQWKKHGRCSGLSPEAYYAQAAQAYARFETPESLKELSCPSRQDPDSIEHAILDANPDLEDENIKIVCKNGQFAEIRLCLDRTLNPTKCQGEAARDCTKMMRVLPTTPAAHCAQ